MFPALLFTIALSILQHLPSPHDRDGLGLRISLDRDRPFLERESIDHVPMTVTLINYSKKVRELDVFVIALKTGDLDITITGPDGKRLRSGGPPFTQRDPSTVMYKLRPGECISDTFVVSTFGSRDLFQTGRYSITATIMVEGKAVLSPPIYFDMIRLPEDSILVSQSIPVVGFESTLPVEKRQRATIEQVKVGHRVWLVYRRYLTGGVFFTSRIAELPGRVEMTVEGLYGEWGPIRISYKTSPTAEPTKLSIQAVDGMPWGEAEELSWQKRQHDRKNPPPKKP